MAGRITIQGMHVDNVLVQGVEGAAQQRLRVSVTLEGGVPYNADPHEGLDLSGTVRLIQSWAHRPSHPTSLNALLRALIDHGFKDPRVHTVDAEVLQVGTALASMDGSMGVGMTLDRTLYQLYQG